ncbi:MAG: hypothetical protein JWO58_447 [Chitinophagaceae bacterium]|nr:hypothetical protein [Chitinophagaceae bacterium]
MLKIEYLFSQSEIKNDKSFMFKHFRRRNSLFNQHKRHFYLTCVLNSFNRLIHFLMNE